jgi:hypothetical protein
MSRQEVFDEVYKHYVIEGNELGFKSAVAGGVGCMYRSETGACFIGHFITQEDYEGNVKSMEGWPVEDLFVHRDPPGRIDSLDSLLESVTVDDHPEGGMEFLEMLQTAHDEAATKGIGRGYTHEQRRLAAQWSLWKVAVEYGLTVPS